MQGAVQTDAYTSQPGRQRRKWRNVIAEYSWFFLLVLPNLLLFTVFTYWPIVFTFGLSFTDWNMIRPQRNFVGFENYTNLLTSATFHKVVGNTLLYSFGTVFVRIALSLFFAVLLFQALRGRAFFRTVIFLPHVTTTAAAAVVWIFVLDPQFGLVKVALDLVGLASPRFLADPNWALFAIMLVGIWKTVGFSTVIYLAGLSGIDSELQEAARIDGAGEWQVFAQVTLPLLSPITLFLVITGIIGSLQTFEIPAIMTAGGPLNATKLYAVYLYELAFQRFRAGPASALAMLFFAVTLMITIVNLRLSKRWVHY